ncbi:MAG TPA: fatty acid desaturase [Acidimicrobiales bacterium]|nr:fatty acid desaturase [Acidimicrobiales bacterium]
MTNIIVAVAVGLATCQIGILFTTVFLHRTLSHRAITMSPGLRFACRFIVWISTGIRPRQWVGVHRRHHAFTDVAGDPHSPAIDGFARVQVGNVVLYRKAARDGTTVEKYAKDLPPDRWDRVLFDHALLGLGLGVAGLYFAFGMNWEMTAIAAAVHTVTYLGLNSAVNAVGHTYGRRPFEGLATNSQWLAWLTAGEGLHSNHHAAPTSARLSFARREIDPGWWFVAAARRLRWLTVRHMEPRLAADARRAA